ncbi:MAG TPA: GAF domain-containing SpoIIE family protein phosphatase [Acidimicrobiales bacterium]
MTRSESSSAAPAHSGDGPDPSITGRPTPAPTNPATGPDLAGGHRSAHSLRAGPNGWQGKGTSDAVQSRDEQLRDLQAVSDAALSRLSADELLGTLLDRVVRIVDADTATVLLLDAAAGVLAARASRGVEEEVRQGVRIPVGVGFAGRIAAERRPVMVDRVDSTTVTNPILWERGIQVMLGVPLLAAGELLGVLHVGRCGPSPFSSHDSEILSVAAERVAAAIQTEQRRQAQDAAAALIDGLRPGPAPRCPGFEFATRYLPAERGGAGGDWYDLFLGEAGQLWIVIGDVEGHGLGAAVIMGRAQSVIRAYASFDDDPAAVLERADRTMQRFDPGTLVTAICAVMSPPYDHMRLAVAGHPPPVLAAPGKPAELLAPPIGPPLGLGIDSGRSVQKVPFPKGATAVFYTDGLIERPDEPMDVSLDRLRRNVRPEPAEDLCRDLLRRHLGPEALRDDAALLAVHALPG